MAVHGSVSRLQGAVGEFLTPFSDAPSIGSLLGFLTFTHVFWSIVILAALIALGARVFTHPIVCLDFGGTPDDWPEVRRRHGCG
jgi:hypothetical protein